MVLLVGTAKGLLVYDIETSHKIQSISKHFIGFSVNMTFVDERSGRWWVGIAHKHWGQKLHYSDDQGDSWQEVRIPTLSGKKLPDGRPAKLRQIWCMADGGIHQQEVLWLGTDPGALYKSTDNGLSFELVEGLWDHPSRMQQGQWFGAGSDYPFIHSIVVNPNDANHLYVAVSCAGIFETKDGGESWHPKNKGLIAAYLPNPNVEVGHDPHVLLMDQRTPELLWQQNHCGIFISRDGGAQWQEISAKEGIPNYGFAMVIDEHNPGKAWVIPVESDERRVAPGLRLQVFQTADYGASWSSVSKGLPSTDTFDIVLRQSFSQKDQVMVFGTTNGNLYFSSTEEVSWRQISSHLTKVNSLYIY